MSRSTSQARTPYPFAELEPRWQAYWEKEAIMGTAALPKKGKKFYVLDMFPYPSGAGLHMGHPLGYTATDAVARFKKAQAYQVLHPMGFDAFGLPTEQYAIETNQHPEVTTSKNIAYFKSQLKSLGFVYNCRCTFSTTDADYYRWTQWIFRKLFEKGLAYVAEKPVWFCPNLGTVLANEEVLHGEGRPLSERGQHPVERRKLRQWLLRITHYADALLAGLEKLNWPESTKKLQRNWIGKSKGIDIAFEVEGSSKVLEVFTTRAETLLGVTYLVLAPEHPYVEELTEEKQRAKVLAYREEAARKSELDRVALSKEKTGLALGARALHPLSGEALPLFIADYVLADYGKAAVMAVPAHDARDYAFALAHRLPMRVVLASSASDTLPYTKQAGRLINSAAYTGLSAQEGRKRIVEDLVKKRQGRCITRYQLRDWLFCRQRYWGEPIPIVWMREVHHRRLIKLYKDSALLTHGGDQAVSSVFEGESYRAVALPQSQLPLKLPPLHSFQYSKDAFSPLDGLKTWKNIALNLLSGQIYPLEQADGKEIVPVFRETQTMPQWAGSSWYYLRYADVNCQTALISPEAEKYWKVPDLYVGGAEHAVLHLLYARFWHFFLKDIGVVQSPEPFPRLFHQGLLLGEDGEKMSKSRGNVVNPDAIIKSHGADTLRLYLMFLGPLEASKPWSHQNIEGVHRFLKRLWSLSLGESTVSLVQRQESSEKVRRTLAETVKKITEDYQQLSFNTAVAQLMICLNAFYAEKELSKASLIDFLKLLAPLAPHICEELYARLGKNTSIVQAPWPLACPADLKSTVCKVVVQVNGKRRGELEISEHTGETAVLKQAKILVAKYVENKAIARSIYVKGKVVNFVL